MTDPTRYTYVGLTEAYDFFNRRLFGGSRPRCLITMQRKNKAYGYFAGDRFGTMDGDEVTDEIALNPSHFRERTTEQSLSTLVHEMVHLQQHHFGKISRNGYHNAQWAEWMRTVGLEPSSTGAPGGKTTGERVSHYILADGAFDVACHELIESGFTVRYVELSNAAIRTKTAASKTSYTCPICGMNAWGKPDIHILCEGCNVRLEP